MNIVDYSKKCSIYNIIQEYAIVDILYIYIYVHSQICKKKLEFQVLEYTHYKTLTIRTQIFLSKVLQKYAYKSGP